MRLERHCYSFDALFPRPLHNVAEHVTVGTMYAVEVPHGHDCRAEARRHILEFVKHLHVICLRSDLNLKFQFHPVVRQLHMLRQGRIGGRVG